MIPACLLVFIVVTVFHGAFAVINESVSVPPAVVNGTCQAQYESYVGALLSYTNCSMNRSQNLGQTVLCYGCAEEYIKMLQSFSTLSKNTNETNSTEPCIDRYSSQSPTTVPFVKNSFKNAKKTFWGDARCDKCIVYNTETGSYNYTRDGQKFFNISNNFLDCVARKSFITINSSSSIAACDKCKSILHELTREYIQFLSQVGATTDDEQDPLMCLDVREKLNIAWHVWRDLGCNLPLSLSGPTALNVSTCVLLLLAVVAFYGGNYWLQVPEGLGRRLWQYRRFTASSFRSVNSDARTTVPHTPLDEEQLVQDGRQQSSSFSAVCEPSNLG